MSMKDAMTLIAQIRSVTLTIVGFALVVLLAGTVARTARLGLPWLPGLDPMAMGAVAVGYWALK